MKWFLYSISIFFIAIGCCTILYTNESRKFVRGSDSVIIVGWQDDDDDDDDD